MTARTGDQSHRFPLVACAAIAAAALTLTGCAAGQRAQTAVEAPAVDGVAASVGAIDIRNLSVAPPGAGASKLATQLLGAIVNNSATDDQLLSVTSPSAKQVLLFKSSADAVSAASASPAPSSSSAISSDSVAASSSPAASATTSAAASSPTAASSSAAASVPLTIPGGSLLQLGPGSGAAVIQLTGLSAPLQPASLVRVTFRFANAGAVTVTVAVHLSSGSASPSILPTSVSQD